MFHVMKRALLWLGLVLLITCGCTNDPTWQAQRRADVTLKSVRKYRADLGSFQDQIGNTTFAMDRLVREARYEPKNQYFRLASEYATLYSLGRDTLERSDEMTSAFEEYFRQWDRDQRASGS